MIPVRFWPIPRSTCEKSPAEPCRASQSQQSSIRRPTKRAGPCFPETMGFSPWKSHGKAMGNPWETDGTMERIINWWFIGENGHRLYWTEREREPPKASQVNGDLRGPIYKQQWLTIIQLHWSFLAANMIKDAKTSRHFACFMINLYQFDLWTSGVYGPTRIDR